DWPDGGRSRVGVQRELACAAGAEDGLIKQLDVGSISVSHLDHALKLSRGEVRENDSTVAAVQSVVAAVEQEGSAALQRCDHADGPAADDLVEDTGPVQEIAALSKRKIVSSAGVNDLTNVKRAWPIAQALVAESVEPGPVATGSILVAKAGVGGALLAKAKSVAPSVVEVVLKAVPWALAILHLERMVA